MQRMTRNQPRTANVPVGNRTISNNTVQGQTQAQAEEIKKKIEAGEIASYQEIPESYKQYFNENELQAYYKQRGEVEAYNKEVAEWKQAHKLVINNKAFAAMGVPSLQKKVREILNDRSAYKEKQLVELGEKYNLSNSQLNIINDQWKAGKDVQIKTQGANQSLARPEVYIGGTKGNASSWVPATNYEKEKLNTAVTQVKYAQLLPTRQSNVLDTNVSNSGYNNLQTSQKANWQSNAREFGKGFVEYPVSYVKGFMKGGRSAFSQEIPFTNKWWKDQPNYVPFSQGWKKRQAELARDPDFQNTAITNAVIAGGFVSPWILAGATGYGVYSVGKEYYEAPNYRNAGKLTFALLPFTPKGNKLIKRVYQKTGAEYVAPEKVFSSDVLVKGGTFPKSRNVPEMMSKFEKGRKTEYSDKITRLSDIVKERKELNLKKLNEEGVFTPEQMKDWESVGTTEMKPISKILEEQKILKDEIKLAELNKEGVFTPEQMKNWKAVAEGKNIPISKIVREQRNLRKTRLKDDLNRQGYLLPEQMANWKSVGTTPMKSLGRIAHERRNINYNRKVSKLNREGYMLPSQMQGWKEFGSIEAKPIKQILSEQKKLKYDEWLRKLNEEGYYLPEQLAEARSLGTIPMKGIGEIIKEQRGLAYNKWLKNLNREGYLLPSQMEGWNSIGSTPLKMPSQIIKEQRALAYNKWLANLNGEGYYLPEQMKSWKSIDSNYNLVSPIKEEFVSVSHATRNTPKKESDIGKGKKWESEDAGLYVTPEGEGSPYFLGVKKDQGVQYSWNPFKGFGEEAQVWNLKVSDIQRLPSSVRTKAMAIYNSQGRTKAFEYINKWYQGKEGKGYIPLRSELGHTSETQAIIPYGTKIMRNIEGNMIQRLKGYKKYTIYEGEVIPIRDINVKGGEKISKIEFEKVRRELKERDLKTQEYYRSGKERYESPYKYRSKYNYEKYGGYYYPSKGGSSGGSSYKSEEYYSDPSYGRSYGGSYASYGASYGGESPIPSITTRRNPSRKTTTRIRRKEKMKTKLGYQPIMDGRIKGDIYETELEAENSGQEEVDDSKANRFSVKRVKAPEYMIKRRAVDNRISYKFKYQNGMFYEKQKYRKDKPREGMNWMAMMPRS